ncbi:MAG: RNA polymerase sigma factor [Chitinophagaceae bacterium]|nr:MAG: RNA polymerase sigma factor [Chitinophagaceae bacterium]
MGIQEFNTLVVHSAEGLRPFAITLTRDREAARDLCQETVCKALTHRDKYQPGTNIKAWLSTIMRNIFINDYRRDERKRLVFDAVQYAARNGSPAAGTDSGIRLQEINRALYGLPAIFKQACLLYLQGYKYQEIADALNEPLGTIKSRIHFARKMLQKRLDR